MNLTIGIPTYRDWEGLWATIAALRLYHDVRDIEILVVDNFGCELTEAHCDQVGARYVRLERPVGSAAAKNTVFEHATGDLVLCIDSHVILHPQSIDVLMGFYGDHPACSDLIHGSMAVDKPGEFQPGLQDEWGKQMWGTWLGARRVDETEPEEIWGYGMGLFASRRDAWLGYNEHFRGYGGEEGYAGEKYRQAGRRVLRLPQLKWSHRFGRSLPSPHPNWSQDLFRNYLIGLHELDVDPSRCVENTKEHLPMEAIVAVMKDTAELFETGHSRRDDEIAPTGVMAGVHLALAKLNPMDRAFLLSKYFGRPLKRAPASC